MLIEKKAISSMFDCAATKWQENMEALSEIDSRFGDGDHGFTMAKIGRYVQKQVMEWQGEDIKEFVENLGTGITGISGGSAGPLYGTMVSGLAEALQSGQTEVDAATLKVMLNKSKLEMFDISEARQGDKTMMDALIPAAEAAQSAQEEPLEVLKAAAEAARQGAEGTREMVSKFGRARSYGEQTLGTPDAGAVSTSLFFEGLLQGAQKALA